MVSRPGSPGWVHRPLSFRKSEKARKTVFVGYCFQVFAKFNTTYENRKLRTIQFKNFTFVFYESLLYGPMMACQWKKNLKFIDLFFQIFISVFPKINHFGIVSPLTMTQNLQSEKGSYLTLSQTIEIFMAPVIHFAIFYHLHHLLILFDANVSFEQRLWFFIPCFRFRMVVTILYQFNETK